MILQFLLNGLISGILYSLLAIGFTLVYNTTRIFHIVVRVCGLRILLLYAYMQHAHLDSIRPSNRHHNVIKPARGKKRISASQE